MDLSKFIEKFGTEEKCENYLISMRWGSKDDVVCPHCKCSKVYHLNHRIPFKCADCKKMFTVKTGTVFAESNIKLTKWYMAMYFLGTAKKGMSSVELGEKLGVTQKTAWFMAHRLREACLDFNKKVKGTVEVDATFVGGKEKNKHTDKKLHEKHTDGKTAVMGAVSREDKKVIAYPTGEESRATAEIFITNKIEKNSMIYADNSGAYNGLVPLRVNHSRGEYVRNDIHTNNIESFWAIIKRGYVGIYHQWSKKHLHRYIQEFTYRYNHRGKEMIDMFITGSVGKRIQYKKLIS